MRTLNAIDARIDNLQKTLNAMTRHMNGKIRQDSETMNILRRGIESHQAVIRELRELRTELIA